MSVTYIKLQVKPVYKLKKILFNIECYRGLFSGFTLKDIYHSNMHQYSFFFYQTSIYTDQYSEIYSHPDKFIIFSSLATPLFSAILITCIYIFYC